MLLPCWQPLATPGRKHLTPAPLAPACLACAQVLPDIAGEPDRWLYVGTEVFKETGDSAHVYEWTLTGVGR